MSPRDPRNVRPHFKRCKDHDQTKLTYVGSHAEADRRLARGERQRWCEECGRWNWPHKGRRRKEAPDAE